MLDALAERNSSLQREKEREKARIERTKAKARLNSALTYQAILDGTVNAVIEREQQQTIQSEFPFLNDYLRKNDCTQLLQAEQKIFSVQKSENVEANLSSLSSSLRKKTVLSPPNSRIKSGTRKTLQKNSQNKPPAAYKKPLWALTSAQHRVLATTENVELLEEFENFDFDSYAQKFNAYASSPACEENVAEEKACVSVEEKCSAAMEEEHTFPEPVREEKQLPVERNKVRVRPQTALVASTHPPPTLPQSSLTQRCNRVSVPISQPINWLACAQNLDKVTEKRAADRVLEKHRRIRRVHSNSSVRRILSTLCGPGVFPQFVPD